MRVAQRIVNHLPAPRAGYQIQISQNLQLVRDRGLTEAENLCQVADAEFAGEESRDDFYPRRVRKDFESKRKGSDFARFGYPFPGFCNLFRIDAVCEAERDAVFSFFQFI